MRRQATPRSHTLSSHATRQHDLLPIFAIAFVGSLGYGLVLPFLVFVVERLGGNGLVYGALGATYSAFQLVGAPLLGRWSDRVGRRRVLLVSQLGTLVSWIIFLAALYMPISVLAEVDTEVTGAFTLTLPLVVLFGARALDGLTGGNVSVANAWLADVTTAADRTRDFGRMSVWSNLGFVLGPAVAGLLGGTALGASLPVAAAIAVSVFASALVLWHLEESRPRVITERLGEPHVGHVLGPEQKECYTVRAAESVTLADALWPRRIRTLLAIHFLVFLAFNFFYVAFPVHAATHLQWSLLELGAFFSAMGLAMALVQGPILGAVADLVSARSLVVVGGLVLSGGFAVLGYASGIAVYAAAVLVALGNGLMWPSLLSLLSAEAGERTQGVVQGFASSSSAFASIVGLLLGGLLYEVIGGQVFLVAAGVVLTGAGAAQRVRLRKRFTEELSPGGIRSALRKRSRHR